ncbi:MAG: ArsR family transcriptional regulator [Acidobacteria bacterium]|nr:MAG: ArsR family transcriptional regulator [Acidobacteriota bacterium]
MNSADLFRLLGDSMRLRMLRLLSREKLNVSELTGIFGMAQSGISRHLRLLRDAGMVMEEREGGWAYYSVQPKQFSNGLTRIWPLLEAQLEQLEQARQDDARLQEVLRERKEDFRDTSTRGISPGRSWAAWARAIGYLLPKYTVADLGCGEGYLTLEVARWAKKVIAVDSSQAALKHAKHLAQKKNVKNISWKHGVLEQLPIESESVEIVLMAQVLHALTDPAIGLREAYRILKPSGMLIQEELRTHQEEWVKDKLGDKKLGFEPAELHSLLQGAKFTNIEIEVGSKRKGDPFVVLIGCGRKEKVIAGSRRDGDHGKKNL